ncbi:Formamidopyrimidine-DNA glycosylase-like protein [Drosera capensis]
MPELPEVEAARRAISENCVGKKIVRSIVADDAKVIDGVSSSQFEAALLHKTIVATHRKGKNLWIQLDSPPFPSFQFGMAGAVYIKGVMVTKYKRSAVKDSDEWPSKYSKVFIELDDGLELSFTDKRRFAKVRLLKDPASVPPISELGPDALLELWPVDEFHESLRKRKIGIKALLLDQGFLSGIGNWIADEVLFQARIHPMQIASSLSKENTAALHKSIKEVIEYAVQVDADAGSFPLDWLFHYRWGKKPGKVIEKAVEVGADSDQYPSNWIFHSREKKPGKAFVEGKQIDFITAGGRTTAYVPDLQKLNGGQATKAPSKTMNRASTKKNKAKKDDSADDTDGVDTGAETGEDSAEEVKSKPDLTRNDNRQNRRKQAEVSGSKDVPEAAEAKKNQRLEAGRKRKTLGSSNDEGDKKNDKQNVKQKKPRVGSEKVASKTNFEKADARDVADHDDDEDDKKIDKATKRRQKPKALSIQKVETYQKTRTTRKRNSS